MRPLLAIVFAAVVLATGCTSSKGSGEGPTAPSSTPSSSSTSAASPTSTIPPTTAAPQSTIGFATPRQAAQHLVDAWRKQDRSAALQGADPAAVDQMFTAPPPNGSIYECDKGDTSPSYCGVQVYGAKQLYIRLEMVQRPAGWVVDLADVEPLY